MKIAGILLLSTHIVMPAKRAFCGPIEALTFLVSRKLKFPPREHALEAKIRGIPLSIVAGGIFGDTERGKGTRTAGPPLGYRLRLNRV